MMNIELAPRMMKKPMILEKSSKYKEIDFAKEMAEIEEARKKIDEILMVEPVDEQVDVMAKSIEEDSTRQVVPMSRERLAAILEKNRKEKHKIIDAESDKLCAQILNALKDCTDEEIARIAVLSLNNDKKLNNIADIYTKRAKEKGEEFIEPFKVATEALSKTLRVVKARIEVKHREFPRVEPVKMMKL